MSSDGASSVLDLAAWWPRFKEWIVTRGPWWLTSVTVHGLILISMAFIVVATPKREGQAPAFEAKVDTALPDPDLERFDVGETPLEPTELNTETLSLTDAPQMAQEEQINTTEADPFVEAGGGRADSAAAEALGGLGGFSVVATGPGAALKGPGGVGGGVGTGTHPGSGGGGTGFGGRGSGVRKAMVGSYGGTKGSERAVAAALNWFARHQMPDGSWSLGGYPKVCRDPSCTCPGSENADVAATAMALLPFLAAGQTHKTKGPYQKTIYGGLSYLLRQQKKDGDLQGTGRMYAHGLATITLCEAYGLSHDSELGYAAQAAVNFIANAQNPETGGWHYAPRGVGDTSVVGWQVMGLKSGQMAGLSVPGPTFEGAKHWLKGVASGKGGGLFAYSLAGGASNTMTAVGLLCSQYLGKQRNDPAMEEGMEYLMANMPTVTNRNCYYWYYATQVMHNMPGPEWDKWNRQMRRVLIESQVKTKGCAEGSWDPDLPYKDVWSAQGGRIMVTSLCCLTLEVYYRYLPLYKLDNPAEAATADASPASAPAKGDHAKAANKREKAAAKRAKK